MKTVNVRVTIQMDIPDTNSDVNEVQNILDAVNVLMHDNNIESQPQIFTSAIDDSDITLNPF